MLDFTVWIDADSCQKQVRAHIEESAEKYSFNAFFVANREIFSDGKGKFCHMVVCDKEKNAADDHIFEKALENDIVITKDIPFAARLVEKNICSMNDRGFVFTKYNIQDKLMERNLNMNLAEIGFGSKNKKSYYGEKEFSKFVRCFDSEVGKRVAMRACAK